jgi:hypothetical protein
MQWCQEVRYDAWYLAKGEILEQPEVIQNRSRCHLLLQPTGWPYPEFLKSISESAELSTVSLVQPEL